MLQSYSVLILLTMVYPLLLSKCSTLNITEISVSLYSLNKDTDWKSETTNFRNIEN